MGQILRLVAITLALAAAAGVCRAGEMTAIPCDLKPDQAMFGPAGDGQKFLPAPADSGVKSASALVVRVPLAIATIMAAVDTVADGGTRPDLVRIDFSGKGKFNDANVVPLVSQKTGGYSFGPKVLGIRMGGKAVPVTISGTYSESPARQLVLHASIALEGRCTFGDKSYPIRILDANGNLRLGEAMTADPQSANPQPQGDLVLIDTGDDGTFQPKNVVQACIGQPVHFKDAWYEISVSKDLSEVTARPATVQFGRIKIDHDSWSCLLVGKKNIQKLVGGREPIEVPADSYAVFNYIERVGKADDDNPPMFTCASAGMTDGRRTMFDVAPDTTTALAVGSPLVAKAIIDPPSGRIVLDLRDQAGATVVSVTGLRLSEPDFEIVDAAGKGIYKASMEFG